MAKRTYAAAPTAPAAQTQIPWTLILGGVAVAAGVYMLMRKPSGATGVIGPSDKGAPATPGTGTTPRTQPAPQPTALPQPDALTALLLSSPDARTIFNIQANGYSLGVSDEHPSGVFTAGTQRLINYAERTLGIQPSTGPSPQAVGYVRRFGQSTSSPSLRLLPFTIQVDALNALNRDMQSADPGGLLVQAYRTA